MKYFCRECKGLRNHDQIHETKINGSTDRGEFQWVNKYSIIKCLGCDNISFLEIYGDTEMILPDEEGSYDYYYDETIYPYYLEAGNELENIHYIPISIKNIYTETISALKSKSYILSAGGLRAIIEAICNDLKIKNGNLAERIDLLHQEGHLSKNESLRLHSIRFIGNDALHEIEIPSKKHLIIMLDIVNHLLANLYINDKKMEGSVDTIIKEYEGFLKLVRSKISSEMVGKVFTLYQILGKSSRQIPKKEKETFENIFKDEVGKGAHEFASIVKSGKSMKFKIEKEPLSTFTW